VVILNNEARDDDEGSEERPQKVDVELNLPINRFNRNDIFRNNHSIDFRTERLVENIISGTLQKVTRQPSTVEFSFRLMASSSCPLGDNLNSRENAELYQLPSALQMDFRQCPRRRSMLIADSC
jgi:hypothetical protein